MARVANKNKPIEMVRGKTDELPVDKLLLDFENPRLTSGDVGVTQDELVKVLWTEMAVDEVAFSIAANGFFPEEPLLVIPADEKKQKEHKGKYIIIEGNRRFAAVRLLREPRLREKVRAVDLPNVAPERLASLDKIPVSIYPDRQSLWSYCGFRHINGIKPWDAFSKAKYVADVYENYDVPLAKIATTIGDRHATVVRLYRGYKILQQAEAKAGFDKEDRVRNRFYFSHLYTAADQPEFQKFLGIDSENSLKANPVPKSKLPQLGQLMLWLYGKKSAQIEPVVRTQNPDLNILREVISKPASLSALRSGYSLEKSFEIRIGDKRRFRDSITSAKEELQQAKGTVTTGYVGEEDLYETMKDILLYGDKIKEEMELKRSNTASCARNR
jgi:hypothetical protein